MLLSIAVCCCGKGDGGRRGSPVGVKGKGEQVAEQLHKGSRNGGIPAEMVEITPESLRERVDRGARKRLGLSGWEEFAEKYYGGVLPDTLAVNELGILLDSAESRIRA